MTFWNLSLSLPLLALLTSLSACSVLEQASTPAAEATGIQRVPIANPKFPISAAVIVPAGYDTIYVSGALPDVANPEAPKGTVEAYGGTEVQTESVLRKLGETLKGMGLGYADVVAAHVYLVGDPRRSGEIDFAGMNAAYGRVFGTAEQPNKPARAAMQIAALVVPGTLVEIEFIAARRH